MDHVFSAARRWVGAALVCAAAVWLAGCGDSGAPATPGASASASASGGTSGGGEPVRIGVSIPAATHGWTAGLDWWARRAMALYGDQNVEFIYSTAPGPAKQVGDVEDMLTRGIDALVLLATESAPLTPVAEKVAERGVYLVNVDRGLTKPVADVFLEGDNEAFGRRAAEFMVERLGGQGRVVILRGIPSTVDTTRYEAAMEVFDAHEGIEVLGVQSGKWNRADALSVMEAFLQKHPRIDAVWAADDDMALGAEQAIREAGRAQEMWLFPGGGSKTIVKKIMDGEAMYPANVTYSPAMIASGIHLAVSAVRDGKEEQISSFFPRHVKLDVELITPDNAGRYYFPDSVY